MVDLPQISQHEMVLRLGLAVVCGALVGLEREWRDRAAGLRTHMLVCVGSAVFMIISAYGFSEWGELAIVENNARVIADPARVAAQIVSGIGFLGAGVIWRSRGGTHGLTTAATLWVMASVGMAAGIGQYWLAMTTTAIILFTLLALRIIGHWIKDHKHLEELDLTMRVAGSGVLKELNKVVAEYGDIEYSEVGSSSRDGGKTIVCRLSGIYTGKSTGDVIAEISAIEGVYSISVDNKEED